MEIDVKPHKKKFKIELSIGHKCKIYRDVYGNRSLGIYTRDIHGCNRKCVDLGLQAHTIQRGFSFLVYDIQTQKANETDWIVIYLFC